MKERPIIFSTDMVKAILEGKKTQTRRVVKLPDAPNHLGQWEPTYLGGDGTTKDSRGQIVPRIDGIWHTRTGKFVKCPYGKVEDRLWVRETWHSPEHLQIKGLVTYKASSHPYILEDIKWRPSIFMPRWASRILLEITEVRVERVQEICSAERAIDFKNRGINPETEVLAEGVEYMPPYAVGVFGYNPYTTFIMYWDSLNAKRGYGWDKNPWVWVVSFRRID